MLVASILWCKKIWFPASIKTENDSSEPVDMFLSVQNEIQKLLF